MAQQTAMHYLLSMIEQMYNNASTLEVESAINDVINIITQEGMPMEKEQIVDAHIEGQRVFDKHDHTQWTTNQAEKYYNETYKK